MKKIFASLFVLLTVQFFFSQENINIGDFNSVKVFDQIKVNLIPSSKQSVEVTGSQDKTSDVQVINSNKELKIRMKTLKTLSGDDVVVNVYFKKLGSIDANEGANVYLTKSIEASILTLNAKEGASINIADINADKLVAKANSGATIEVSGKSTDQDVVITSGGKYYAKNLTAKNSSISINAGGKGELTVKNELKAKVRAGGTIDVYGNPQKVDKKTIIGGNIEIHK